VIDSSEIADGSTTPEPTPTTTAPHVTRRTMLTARRASGLALTVLVVFAAYVAVHLHRRGHTTGDDFALYLRQAQSLFEGNIAQVITDNRLLWQHSVGVTPQMYPWGFAVLLSPFVRVFGLDFGRLKLVEVACFCAWLVLFHGIARRRAGRVVAIAVTAVFATAPLYLLHTDQLLTEFPHMLAVAVVIWWLDRVMSKHRLTDAPVADLVILGLLVVAAYNVRREGIVLVMVVAAAQLVDVLGVRTRALERGLPSPWRRGSNPIAALPWRRLAVPHLSFAAGAIIAQFLLPSTLLPDNGNSRRFILTRLFNLTDQIETRDRPNYPKHLLLQLGLQERPIYGLILIGLALAGVVVACAKSPRLNVPLAALMILTMTVIGTHFRMVSRYYFQVTPLIVLFATMLLVAAASEVVSLARKPPRWLRPAATGLALAPVLWLTTIHIWSIPARLDSANRYNDSGAVQSGPTNPRVASAFEIIDEHTRPDDIIVYYRARTLTLYTDRRALQLSTTAIPTMTAVADYFMQNRQSDYSQPVATDAELEALGYEVVYDDPNWRLWRIPQDT
jgi:hypothetical protein